MKKITSLEGHSNRVLYLSVSPGNFIFSCIFLDETTLVTGAGDETLKFWNAFPPH